MGLLSVLAKVDLTVDLLTAFGGSEGEKLVASSPVQFRRAMIVKAEAPQSTAMLSVGM